MVLALFFNTAIDQATELFLRDSGRWEKAQRVINSQLESNRPQYIPFGPEGSETGFPTGHDGSGLSLLGTSSKELVEWGALEGMEFERICRKAIQTVRGTVQADILKEDQAQNTCIFSTELALRMMGDIQEFFTREQGP